MGTLTKVEIFSSMLKPHTLSIKGEKVRGIIAENREGEYFYHALFEDAQAGEKMRFEVLIKGKPTRETLKENGYHGNIDEVFEKLTPKRYILHVDGCVWAPHIHRELKPRDVTCPFALIAMAIFEEVLKGKVKVADSEYYENGTKTRIELL